MKKVLLILVSLIVLSSFVYADCVVPYDGMIITQDTTFCAGDYSSNFMHITIGSNPNYNNKITLDCNNSLIFGTIRQDVNYYNKGIGIKNCNIYSYPYNEIVILYANKNSVIENNNFFNTPYGVGIELYSESKNSLFLNNTFNNIRRSYWITSVSNSTFNENRFYNSESPFQVWAANNNLFIDNRFENVHYAFNFINSHSNIISNNFIINSDFMQFYNSNNNNFTKNFIFSNKSYPSVFDFDGAINNNIWDNSFYSTTIREFNFANNSFCINCVGNLYFDGATGPTCPSTCNDADSDGIPDNEDKCPNTIGEQVVYGCSCEQILALKPGENTLANKEGCSKGVIDVFTKAIGWAKDLF